MEVNQLIYTSKDACCIWQKKTKIQDGRQRPFEQDRFLTNDPVINCDMSFLTSLWARNPFLDLELQL